MGLNWDTCTRTVHEIQIVHTFMYMEEEFVHKDARQVIASTTSSKRYRERPYFVVTTHTD